MSEMVYQRVAGIDVSKSDAKVCVRVVPEGRTRSVSETRVFGSTMAEIRRLRV